MAAAHFFFGRHAICGVMLLRAHLMRIGRCSRIFIAIVLFVLAAAGLSSSRTGVAGLLIAPAHAQEASSLSGLDGPEVERFIRQNPGTLLAAVALPIILLLTILVHRRHYVGFSILVGALAGAACQTLPGIAALTVSPILARILQSIAAALVALALAAFFDLMFLIGRLSCRLIHGTSLHGPDPLREWFREAILVQRWAPPPERAQEVDDAVVRWHIALVTGAGALVATVLRQGHFVAGLHEHVSATGFLTTSVILIAAFYILEPVRERILAIADPEHRQETAKDSLVRTVIESPRRGWLLSASIVLGVLLVQVLIIGLEEAIHKAALLELLELGFSGLGPMPIAYFLCAALQKGLDLKYAMRGTSVFSALLLLAFLLTGSLVAGISAGAIAVVLAKNLLGSGLASSAILLLVWVALALIVSALLFWPSLGAALAGGFVFSGLAVWVLQVVWPRTRGGRPLTYLALAIAIATLIETPVIAPLDIWAEEPGKPSTLFQSLVVEPVTLAAGWLIGFWLSGIAGVLETYQQRRPELFPRLKMPPPKEATSVTEI